MYREIRDANDNLILYKKTSTSQEIPIDNGNRDYRKLLEWINEGNIPDPDLETINRVRNQKIEEIKIEAVRRISIAVQEWDNLQTIGVVVSIWNLLDTSKLTTQQIVARDTYLFAVNTAIPSIKSMTNIKNIQAVDVRNHSGWPA